MKLSSRVLCTQLRTIIKPVDKSIAEKEISQTYKVN